MPRTIAVNRRRPGLGPFRSGDPLPSFNDRARIRTPSGAGSLPGSDGKFKILATGEIVPANPVDIPLPEADFGGSLSPVFGPEDIVEADANIQTLLTEPAPTFTPELTRGVLDLIQRRGRERTSRRAAGSQSDFLRRGGTGSSVELQERDRIREEGLQQEADEELAFLLSAAEAGERNRQFNVNTGLNLLGNRSGLFTGTANRQFQRGQLESQQGFTSRENLLSRRFQEQQEAIRRRHEEVLMNQYLRQLAQINESNRKRRKRRGISRGFGKIAGTTIGAFAGGLPGAQLGNQAGGDIAEFLFS